MKQMKGGTMFNQREIVILPFPYSDLTGAKQRPAIIISNDKLNKTKDRICCLITSNKPQDGIYINSLENGDLPFESWIKPQRLFTINEKIIKKTIGAVSVEFHEKIVEMINWYIKSL